MPAGGAQTCEKEKSALAAGLEALEKTAEELQRARDDAERRASTAKAEAEAEAKRTLERERKGMHKDSSLQVAAAAASRAAAGGRCRVPQLCGQRQGSDTKGQGPGEAGWGGGWFR